MANISKLTSDQISEMRRLFEEGVSQKALAERYNVSISTVANKLKNKPLPVKTATVPAPSQAQIDYVRQLQQDRVELPDPMFEQLKKKEQPEKPKRRIVGINI